MANTVIMLVSWFVQVAVGHLVFEGKKPALIDGLVEAFTIAPLFITLEYIFIFIN